ncbi:hypothetical protein I2I05_19600 [Hymenobacter sp. BT683]|uniref:Uncharacterized protein n=1 Tax=Hymenobacter jeongseonensis TaxID=2791027 RepID=A0ABS0IN35_9BACT|nr:hypothetical protein [Hymenobacter jeongseonensis]MBF9239607.1 hypothetical protein [Hymenobacter jeongseonensis]
MPSSKPTPVTDLTQLVRYILTIDNMHGPDSIAQVRDRLMGLGLVVDRVVEGEAEVAATSSTGPGLDAIRAALQAGGFRLMDADTQVG